MTRDASLWRERLIRALAEPLTRREAAPGDNRGLADTAQPGRIAGVLIPVVGAEEPFIYFTERSDTLRIHPGQISFPGGSMEPSDADARAAALREAHEEIGLDPAAVDVLGELPDYTTGTGFTIRPFVGWVDPAAPVAPDEAEVARLFGVPIAYALDYRRFERRTLERNGRRRTFFAIDYDGNDIWGATAGILYGLLQRIDRVERCGAATE